MWYLVFMACHDCHPVHPVSVLYIQCRTFPGCFCLRMQWPPSVLLRKRKLLPKCHSSVQHMTPARRLLSWYAIHLEIQLRIQLLLPSLPHKHRMPMMHPASYRSATTKAASFASTDLPVVCSALKPHHWNSLLASKHVCYVYPCHNTVSALMHKTLPPALVLSSSLSLSVTFWPILKASLLSSLLFKWDPVLCGCTALSLPLRQWSVSPLCFYLFWNTLSLHVLYPRIYSEYPLLFLLWHSACMSPAPLPSLVDSVIVCAPSRRPCAFPMRIN